MQNEIDSENLSLIEITGKNTSTTILSSISQPLSLLFKTLNNKIAKLNEINIVTLVSWVATITACGMYISYIPQIMDNLNGIKTSPFQPFVAAINCFLWTYYGVKSKEYPVAIANAPGILFGSFACLSAII